MTILDIVETLPASVVYGPPGYQSLDIIKIIAGDLMSDILLSVNEDTLLVSALATDQTLRTADMIGAKAVLLVNDKLPTQSMKSVAKECGIALIATAMPMYEACCILGFMQGSK